MPRQAALRQPVPEAANVTPVWLLPFWRLVRGNANGDYDLAWQLLPSHLPARTPMPDVHDAVRTVLQHGLIGRKSGS